MNKDLFSLINEKLPSFSKGHKLIANYILRKAAELFKRT